MPKEVIEGETITIDNIEVSVFFNEYNSKTKKRKQIKNLPLTQAMKREISVGMDDTDFGTFFEFTKGNITTTGMFSF